MSILLMEHRTDASIKDFSGQAAIDYVHGFRNDEEIKRLINRSEKTVK